MSCDCRSYNWGVGTREEIILTPPHEMPQGKTVCIDACIADDIKTLWDNGLWTLNSCCGHGRERPSVIVPHGADAEFYSRVLKEKSNKDWAILQWRLHEISAETGIIP